MSSGFEGTPGPWEVSDEVVMSPAVADGDIVAMNPGEMGWYDSGRYWPENARLIAEAGTVLHETGLTPRQLAEQRAKLLEALRFLYRGYVSTLESGRDRIIFLGGACDSLEMMERTDPFLIQTRSAIANATQQRNATGGEG